MSVYSIIIIILYKMYEFVYRLLLDFIVDSSFLNNHTVHTKYQCMRYNTQS